MTVMATYERKTDMGPVGFDDVAIGETLEFSTRDTGYGGRGLYRRTGVVTAKTAKTVTLVCPYGETARIRRADWNERAPRRLAQATTEEKTDG